MDLCRRPNRGLLARAIAFLGATALLLSYALTIFAQDPLNETLTNDGISQPIQLYADNIATWTAAGQQVFLLQGGVIVKQGGNTIRSTDGVVWVDMARYQTERVLHVIVYGENPIALERNKVATQAGYGYVRLATGNKLDIKAFKSKVAQEDKTIDRVYQRALTSRPEGMSLPAGNDPAAAGAPVNGGIRQVGGTQPMVPALPPFSTPSADPREALQSPPPAPQPQQTTTVLQISPEPKLAPAPPAAGDGPIQPPPIFSPNLSSAPTTAAAVKPEPQISIRGRYGVDPKLQYKPIENGWTAMLVTGGVTLIVTQPATTPGGKASTLDMEADRAVIWKKGGQQVFTGTREPQSLDAGTTEIYLAGHVELRSRTLKETETLRADEVYYDVRRGVAVARKADLEMQSAKLQRPLHMVMDEFLQVNPKLYKMKQVTIFSSLLPSDPGLRVDVANLTVEEFQKEKSYLWGWFPAYDQEGKRIIQTDRTFTGGNFVPRLEEVPFFYLPYYRGNVERPLGPLDGVSLGYDRIKGFQILTTWDMFELLNLPRPDGSRWRLMADYLTARGPGLGTEYDFEGKDLFGIKSKYSGLVKLYGTYDRGQDILGGDRGNVIYWPDAVTPNPISHPNLRGWANAQVAVQDLPDGFSVLGKLNFISDRNYLEQYYLNSHLNEMNQETYLYVKQQQNNWAWSVEGQIGTRDWMTETDWLPKADGYLLGQTFLDDWLVYNGHASAGYGRLRPTIQVPFAYLPTDVRADVLRLDWMQEVSLPFYVGPVKVAPYLQGDAAYYSQDVNGDSRGRLYGGAGVRWNMPLSRLYPSVESELLNLNGIYHKINLTGNYYTAAVSSGVNNFPQLDRLNDDVTDQALRDIRPMQTLFNPSNANYLTTNLFNPQNYAIRRLVDNNVDTLDNIDVLQLGINQRWQTKRGFPGNEHVVDWMTLNVGASIFPHSVRDNFGHTFGILEYDWNWNIGDRTALSSSGWFEPWAGGPRVVDFGVTLNRPDTTGFYLGYRQIDPLNSKAVIASVTYPFSAKYALQASTVWDFGTNVRSYSLFVSRMGTDVMVNFGLSFNSTVNTVGIALEILPNMVQTPGRAAGLFPMPPMNIDPMINQR